VASLNLVAIYQAEEGGNGGYLLEI
jgi:hypothetical protein